MAGTSQDRLISELRLAGATTIPEASAVLADFLPRFNDRFRVPAQQTGTAYRPLDPGICLDRILCYKHWRKVARDNTVKYRWRTLQLLPDVEPGTYAGSRAWWKVIHRAKLQGTSNRAIAKNLGNSRNTVKKYLAAESPEMVGAVVTPRIRRSDTMANYTIGQNR